MADQDLWTPSDELMSTDPIADAKIKNPYAVETLSDSGIVLPDDHLDDDALEAAAASVLAEFDDADDDDEDELSAAEDDEAVDDPDDGTPGDDV